MNCEQRRAADTGKEAESRGGTLIIKVPTQLEHIDVGDYLQDTQQCRVLTDQRGSFMHLVVSHSLPVMLFLIMFCSNHAVNRNRCGYFCETSQFVDNAVHLHASLTFSCMTTSVQHKTRKSRSHNYFNSSSHRSVQVSLLFLTCGRRILCVLYFLWFWLSAPVQASGKTDVGNCLSRVLYRHKPLSVPE